MHKFMTRTQVRKRFDDVIDSVKRPKRYVVITREGEPEAVVLSFEEFEGLMETFDIMSDPKERAAIKKALRKKEKGDCVTLKEFTKSLGV